MKTFLILFLISFNSIAGYVAGSKINNCSKTDYSSPSLCQEQEGEVCFKIPNDSGECGIFKLQNIYGSIKFDQETCNGQINCEALLTNKVCGVSRYPLIDAIYSEVYCVELLGKEIVIDTILKSQKDAAKLVKAQFDTQIGVIKKARECGSMAINLLMLRNQSKNLSNAQKKAMAKTTIDIKQLLDVGSLDAAKEEIAALISDGVLITDSDKSTLITEISNCQGL